MKKVVNLVPALVLALSSLAFAQGVEKKADNTETVKVTVSGAIDLNYIYRDSVLADIRGSAMALSAGTPGTNHIAHAISVRLDVELTEKVSAVLELFTYPIGSALGTNSVSSSGTMQFRQVYIQLAEVLDPAVTIKIGQIWQNWDIRGKGSSILLDTVYAEDADVDINSNALLGTNGAITSAPASRGSAGVVVDYKRSEMSFQVGLLPETRAQGSVVASGVGALTVAVENPSLDDSIYWASFLYNLDSVGKGSRLGAIFTLFHTDFLSHQSSNIMTFGGGADLLGLVENMEFYAEVYFQFGDAGETSAASPVTLKAGGMAFNLGANYKFQSDQKPWVELKVTYLSGDKDGTDDKVDNWISYENQADLLILESHVFGVDIDSNYMAVKFGGGLSFSSGGAIQNNIQLSSWIGFAQVLEDLLIAGSTENKLGTEVDVKLTWVYSKAVNLTANVAFLVGSDIFKGLSSADEDKATLYSIGVNCKW